MYPKYLQEIFFAQILNVKLKVVFDIDLYLGLIWIRSIEACGGVFVARREKANMHNYSLLLISIDGLHHFIK